ncbi:MAG: tetratricopeptide repeat protein [Myxococcota bacterium]
MRIHGIAAGLGICLAALGVACSSPEERVKRHLERARLYSDESWQPDKALVELQAALKLDPTNAETNLRIAELLEDSERFEDALFYFEEARRLDPKSDDAALGLARLIRITEPDRADTLLDEVLARSPDSASAHVLRSDVLLVRSDVNGALASALTAAELDPQSARVALQVAIVRKARIAERRQKREPVDDKLFEEADAAFAHALELAKHEPSWVARATIERVRLLVIWRGYVPDQVQIHKDAFELVKDYPEFARQMAFASAGYARAAKNDDFLHWALLRLIEVDPNGHDSWVEMADLATKRGEDGIAVLERIVAERPDDARGHITYAEYLAEHGKHTEAVAHLEGELPKSRAPAATLSALLDLHLAAGDTIAAAEPLAQLQAEHPASAQADYAEARLANAEGRVLDAITALERWTEREETANGFGMLADARLRAGRVRAALEAVDRAISLKQQARPDLQRLRGRILVRLGEYRSALQAFSRSRTRGGPVPVAFVPDLAKAFYELGWPDEGKKALERALAQEVPPGAALLLFGTEEMKRDPEAAQAALERGAALYPNMLQFVALLIHADLRADKPDAAIERARALAEQLPDAPQPAMLLAQTLVSAGRKEEAVKQVEVVQARWPGQPGVAELFLEVMTRLGRGEEAFQALSKQQAEGTLSPHGRVLLAQLLNARGETPQAIELLRSALSQLPGLPAAANDLAYALAKRGESLQEATELAQEARANRPDSSEIADTLGYVYLRRELAEAALVQFEAAVELAEAESPGWATAQFHRGLALRQLGRQPEAVTALEQALASGADFAEVKEAHRVLAELANAPEAASAKPSEGS